MTLWTPDEDARLAELWELGEKTKRIAEILSLEFGRPMNKNHVIGRRNRLKDLKARPSPIANGPRATIERPGRRATLPPIASSTVTSLLLQGVSRKNIAAEVGISEKAVRKIRETIPFDRKKPAPTIKTTTVRYIPNAKCLSPDGCDEIAAPHSPYAYCAKHRREYYAYDPMTDRGREVRIHVPWTGSPMGTNHRGPGGKIEEVEELEKVE